jgi:plasmid replication initiation protein
MIIERFKNGDAVAVYRRLRDRGRMAPDGLRYVSSWVNEACTTCYQVMETADRALLDQWIVRWSDIVDFEVHPVMTSKEAAQKMEPRLLPEVGAAISAHALPASDRSREN